MSDIPQAVTAADEAVPPGRFSGKALGASVIGTIIEWYDFYIYGTAAALIFGKLFFPTVSAASGVLLALATYGVGYVFRPLGGILLSRIGDKVGRRSQLLLSLLLMGASTGLIGLLPTYRSIGLLAPVLLVVLRLAQGFGAGAEFGGAVTLISEYSGNRHRGLWASSTAMAVAIGILAGNGAFTLLSLMPAAGFEAWGWRVPFLVGFAGVLIGLYLRRNVDETPSFKRLRDSGGAVAAPVATLWRQQRRDLFTAIAMQVSLALNTGVVAVFAVSYVTHDLGMSRTVALIGTDAASIAGLVLAPLAGYLSDRLGRHAAVAISLGLVAVQAFPFFWLLQTRNPALVVLGFALLNGAVGMVTGASGAFLVDLFHPRNRTTGIGLARETTSPLAGLTPLLCGALMLWTGSSASISLVLLVVGVPATFIIARMRSADVQP